MHVDVVKCIYVHIDCLDDVDGWVKNGNVEYLLPWSEFVTEVVYLRGR